MAITRQAKNYTVIVKNKYQAVVGGKLEKISDNMSINATDGNLKLASNKKITSNGENGIKFGDYVEPQKPTMLDYQVNKAYFAKREEDTQYKTTVKDHTTKAGETLSKIAKNYKVETKDVKRTKTTKYLQIGEVVNVTTKEKTGVKVKFTKLDKATVGEDVYIVVETLHLEEEIVNINILQGQEDVIVKKGQMVTVQQENQDVTLIKTKVGNYCEEEDISNKDEFVNWAIAKVKLQPKTEAKQKEWKDGLECAGEKKAKLYLLVDVHSENSIPNFKSEYVLYKGFKDGKDNSPIPNHFLNEDNSWFEVIYESVLKKIKVIVDKHIPYSQSGERKSDTLIGWKELDCSELVMRYLYELEAMTDLKNIYTGLMTNEKDFRKAIGTNNIQFVANSLNDSFKPQKGDIFVWRTSSGGHTGIVYEFDESKDLVTILEAIGPGGSRDNSTNKKNGGYTINNCTRTSVYKRKGSALNQHDGWKGYFRPINYNKNL